MHVKTKTAIVAGALYVVTAITIAAGIFVIFLAIDEGNPVKAAAGAIAVCVTLANTIKFRRNNAKLNH